MDRETFIATLREALEPLGFRYTRRRFYCSDDEVIAVIGPQSSRFSHSYYLNVGFLIRELHPDEKHPLDYRCDIHRRLTPGPECGPPNGGAYDLDVVSVDALRASVAQGAAELVAPMLEHGPRWYVRHGPIAIVQGTPASELLGVPTGPTNPTASGTAEKKPRPWWRPRRSH